MQRVICIHPDDSMLVALADLNPGDVVTWNDENILISTPVKTKHKLDRDIWLIPILESALGIENAYKIASASPQVVALTIGLEDYTADLGVPKTALGTESLFARQRLVSAARAAGFKPAPTMGVPFTAWSGATSSPAEPTSLAAARRVRPPAAATRRRR